MVRCTYEQKQLHPDNQPRDTQATEPEEDDMKIEEKIAVLKLAGFTVVNTGSPDGLDWEWRAKQGRTILRIGAENYTTQKSAWDSAWKYIQGDAHQELDCEPWNTPKEDNT